MQLMLVLSALVSTAHAQMPPGGGFDQEALTATCEAGGMDACRLLGGELMIRGEYVAALDAMERNLVMTRENPKRPGELANWLANTASTYHLIGQHKKAITLTEEALGLQVEQYGDDHGIVAGTRERLGFIYDAVGQVDAAVAMFRKAIAARRAIAPDHPTTAQSAMHLARLLVDRDMVDEARPLTDDIERIWMVFAEERPTRAIKGLATLAELYLDMGDADRAATVLDIAIAGGGDSPSTISALEIESEYALRTGDLAKAQAAVARAIELHEGTGRPVSPNLLSRRARVRWAAGERDAAIEDLRAATVVPKSGPGRAPLDNLEHRVRLGWALIATGATAEAKQVLGEALALTDAGLPPDHHSTLPIHLAMAHADPAHAPVVTRVGAKLPRPDRAELDVLLGWHAAGPDDARAAAAIRAAATRLVDPVPASTLWIDVVDAAPPSAETLGGPGPVVYTVIVHGADGAEVVASTPAAELDPAAQAWRAGMAIGPGVDGEVVAKALVRPIEGHLEGVTRTVWSLPPSLAGLPLAAATLSDGRFLVERVTVSEGASAGDGGWEPLTVVATVEEAAPDATACDARGTDVLTTCTEVRAEPWTGGALTTLRRTLGGSALVHLWSGDPAAHEVFDARVVARLHRGDGRADAVAATQREFLSDGPWTSASHWAGASLSGAWGPVALPEGAEAPPLPEWGPAVWPGMGWWPWALGGLALLVVGGGAATMLGRR